MNIDALLKLTYEIEALLKLLKESEDSQKRQIVRELIDQLVDRLDDEASMEDFEGGNSDDLVVAGDEAEAEAEPGPVDRSDEDHIAENAEFEEAADAADADEVNIIIDDRMPEEGEDAEAQAEVANEAVDEPAEEAEVTVEVEDEPSEPISRPLTTDVNDAALQQKAAKSIRQAFTLNDKFRFRRELFGNSDLKFSEALNVIDTFKSKEEAEEYFYDTEGWDAENQDVKDFMRIVVNSVNQSQR